MPSETEVSSFTPLFFLFIIKNPRREGKKKGAAANDFVTAPEGDSYDKRFLSAALVVGDALGLRCAGLLARQNQNDHGYDIGEHQVDVFA